MTIKETLSDAKKKISENVPDKNKVAEFIDDSTITAKAKAALAADDFIKSLKIHVTTEEGVVSLEGNTPSKESLNKIKQIVDDIEGVKRVITNLKIVA